MYRVGIVDGKTHQEKYMSPWRHNLILNSGMYAVASNFWTNCMRYCFAGYGTDDNSFDSSTDVAAATLAGVVTATGSALDFTTFTAGDSILWDTGEQGRILSISAPGACTISTEYANPGGIPSGEFTVLKTSRAKLTGTIPIAGRASSYLTGGSAQLVNYTHNANDSIITNRQTFDFPAVTNVAGETYGEIGLSWADVTGGGPWVIGATQPTLFSRIVIPGTLHLDQGDYLRVVYQLAITIAPTSVTATSIAFDNDGTPESWDGDSKLYNLGLAIINIGNATIGSASSTVKANDTACNEPAHIGGYSYILWVSFVKGVHTGTYPNWGDVGREDSYIQGPSLVATTNGNLYADGLTYSQEKYGTWAIGQVNSSTIKSMGYGLATVVYPSTLYPSVYCGFMNIFDSGHQKLNTQTLTLKIRYSWSRTLTVD
jgi:hypothetical protein